MCTAFRDGFQSVFGARVLTDDFLPAVAAAKEAGIQYFEAGGGARFQSLYFYCNEDAFTMMDRFRETTGPEAQLQTLSRGVNVVGLESQSSDIIKLHADLFKKHGMTTIRNFDALNDVDNLVYSGQAITDAGLNHQICVTLMELPPGCKGAHNPDFYEGVLKNILDAEIPFDSVCFKDASGTSIPSTVHETIKRARKMLPEGTLIHFHTHETAGTSMTTNLAALEAGADAIDLSLAPVSGGTSQPDILTAWHSFRGSDYSLDIDIEKVQEATDVFKDCMKDYFIPPEALAVEPMIPWCPMPGGALTANTQMLRDNGIMEKYPEIILAMREVVSKGGFGTSVTPVSQFYFQQAFNNVMFGTWKKIAPQYGQMVLGYFGKTPVEPDPEVIKLASEQLELEPTTEKPRIRNDKDPNKGVAPARKRLEEEGLPVSDENIFIAATCQDKGIQFLKGEATLGVRKNVPEATAPSTAPAAPAPVTSGTGTYTVNVAGTDYTVELKGNTAVVNGTTVSLSDVQGAGGVASAPAPSAAPAEVETSGAEGCVPVCAQMPGKIMKLLKNPGDTVGDHEALLIMEAMKMEVQVYSEFAGVIHSYAVNVGDDVQGGSELIYLQS